MQRFDHFIDGAARPPVARRYFERPGYGRELGPDALCDFQQVKSVWTGTFPVADPFPFPAAGAEP